VTSELVEEMLSRASSRTVVQPGDARSGSIFERVVIDDAGYFLKRLSPGSDWIMRLTGDDCTVRIWSEGGSHSRLELLQCSPVLGSERDRGL
jgi:hypothetical protein